MTDAPLLPGPAYALLTALCWSAAVVFFKRSGEAMHPVALNVFKNLLGLACFLLTLALGTPESLAESWVDAAILFGSGIVGIAIADTLFFHSLNLLGASRSAIVDCTYSPSIVVLSYVMLGEVLSILDGIGAILIVGAVLMTVARRQESPEERRGSIKGALLGVLAMLLMGVAIVAVKPILDRHDVLWSTTLRLSGGVFGLMVWLSFKPKLRALTLAALRPQASWRVAIPGAFLGTYLSLYFWIAGFKYNDAGVASILNQTSTVFTVLFAWLFLREALTPRAAVAVVLAFGGSLLVLL